ncbi:hypothetical protein PHMEG_00027724 [Phytophthora megakarya]|uniref:Uncharacterized protein n=1 Tax=Phytophthora megakarya TaxID=4795 RepID=A0A225V6K0_9STRA|nr:hypothetical protein PHMEG_00027724 [Phytophthora megakarya]
MPYTTKTSTDEIKVLRPRIALVLFKPFRSISGIVTNDNPSDMDWIGAYALWENAQTAFDKMVMSNMDGKAASDHQWLGRENDIDFDDDEYIDTQIVVDPFGDRGVTTYITSSAFSKIGTALLTKWLKPDPSEGGYQGSNFETELPQDQLLFFLGGAGGTGKSRVIDAVTELCCGGKELLAS